MNLLCKKFEGSPEYARVVPLVVFAGLTALEGRLGRGSEYWVYLLKTFVGAWMICEMRPCLEEMRWKISWEAVAVGAAVFAVWVGLDGCYPRLAKVEAGVGWNPHQQFGQGSAMAWLFIVTRIAGSTLVVPPIEEVFYRSFLYRYLANSRFLAVPFNEFHALPFALTALVFGLAHPGRWVAGILCGLAYQGLALRKNRLGDAMTAHAVTNFLLGIWIVWRGAWSFW
jgi:CAAX prenyl protease-like protein